MARNPHKQGGLATPPPELDDDEPDEPAADEPADEPADDDGEPAAESDDAGDEDQDDAGDDSADDVPDRGAGARARGGFKPGSFKPVNDGAGWVLGLLLWGWVGVPFVKGGPAQVKKVWMAKFLNKAPDGSWLP